MREVIALIEQRFALDAGQGVGEAVAVVQVGAVSTAAAVVAVGLAGYLGLLCGNGLNDHSGLFQ